MSAKLPQPLPTRVVVPAAARALAAAMSAKLPQPLCTDAADVSRFMRTVTSTPALAGRKTCRAPT